MAENSSISFLPWSRRGIGAEIIERDTLGLEDGQVDLRAQVDAELFLETEPVPTESEESPEPILTPIEKTIAVMGPGDVIGIRSDAILKTNPQPNDGNYASNLVAFIEFYEEDFPWRFTPAKANEDKLRPWLALVLLKDEEYTIHQPTDALTYIAIHPDQFHAAFHDHRTTWACAHMQVNAAFDFNETIEDKVQKDPHAAFSRLICPRKLEKSQAYTAFLIPAFESGRLAGLQEEVEGEGVAVKAQKAAWIKSDRPEDVAAHWRVRPYEFPVYHQWRFQTGEFGDFESLVDQLKPFTYSADTGERLMDVSQPIRQLEPSMLAVASESALQAADFEAAAWADKAFQERLKKLLNYAFPDRAADSGDDTLPVQPVLNNGSQGVSDMVDDPLVLPPVYGRRHRGAEAMPDSPEDWLHKLNLDLRYRAIAGTGAQIVKQHQETFVERAWAQVGEAKAANQKMEYATTGRLINEVFVAKHIATLNDSRFLQVTTGMHQFLLDTTKPERQTVRYRIEKSTLPEAVTSAGLQKLIRPSRNFFGRLLKRASQATILSLNEELVKNFALSGSSSVSAAGSKLVPPVAVDLSEYLAALGSDLSLPDLSGGDHTSPAEDIGTQELSQLRAAMSKDIDPAVTLSKRVGRNIHILPASVSGDAEPKDYQPKQELSPYIVHPNYPEPVYHYLKKISQDLIIPNVEKIPENSIAIMEPNLRFIEALLAGMNHEMARELLWREYPTDMRGTYFRTFWDRTDSDGSFPHDIDPMTSWEAAFGHNAKAFSEKGNGLILVVRGELFRKFPETIVFAHKADTRLVDGVHHRYLSDRFLTDLNPTNPNTDKVRLPLFQAGLEPDIFLFAFNLSDKEAAGAQDQTNPGWYFVFQERPGELKMGLDDFFPEQGDSLDLSRPVDPEDLTWHHVLEVTEPPSGHINFSKALTIDDSRIEWGPSAHAAHIAYLLHQRPVAYARHAVEMIPPGDR